MMIVMLVELLYLEWCNNILSNNNVQYEQDWLDITSSRIWAEYLDRWYYNNIKSRSPRETLSARECIELLQAAPAQPSRHIIIIIITAILPSAFFLNIFYIIWNNYFPSLWHHISSVYPKLLPTFDLCSIEGNCKIILWQCTPLLHRNDCCENQNWSRLQECGFPHLFYLSTCCCYTYTAFYCLFTCCFSLLATVLIF